MNVEEIDKLFKNWLLTVYMCREQKDLGASPFDRWNGAITIPRMPDSLEALDLMLLHVGRQRKVQRDGIRFKTFRYFDLELSKYVKQYISVRYDPRDMSEIYVYADGTFVCKAACKELEGREVELREIIKERALRKKEVKSAVQERQQLANQYLYKSPTAESTIEKPAKAEPSRRIFKYFYERQEYDDLSRN